MPVSMELIDPFEVKGRNNGFAAKLSGVDLSLSIDIPTFDRIHRLWMKHPVLVFPDQTITDIQQIAFAKHFGDLEVHPSLAHRADDYPEIYRVSNVDKADRIMEPESSDWQYLELTWLWHTDSSFRPVPSMASILHGIEIPPVGGDTLFADLTAAYEALPSHDRALVQKLRVVHDHEAILAKSKGLTERDDKGVYEHLPPVTHPLVRRHPITGRRSLFLSPHTMDKVEGMQASEGRELLNGLIAHASEDRFVYRHIWKANDVLMWDNRCTMHAVMPYDSINHRRVMHRTTIVGEGPPTD